MELLDRLLAGRDAAEVFRSRELIDDLKKAVAERVLDAEIEAHLESEHASGAGNPRNGHNRKRVLTGGRIDGPRGVNSEVKVPNCAEVKIPTFGVAGELAH